MSTAAEFNAVVTHAYDSDYITVLFTENSHSSKLLGFVDRHLFHFYREILIHLFVYDLLYLADFLSCHRLEVVEVKSQIIVIDI